jgi:pyruvate kinase
MPRLTRTKILCTLGPASESPETIRALIRAGMDCARLNFSHGDYDEYARAIRTIREASDELGVPVAILQDLQGPKIRIGRIEGGEVELGEGEIVRIVNSTASPGTRELLTTTYQELPHDVAPGDRILLDDGRLVLEVRRSKRARGSLPSSRRAPGERKGINLPGVMISTAALTDKDRHDIRFRMRARRRLRCAVVRATRQDIDGLKEEIRAAGGGPQVIAKLEKPQAVENLDEILDRAAGVMIARGDLGVELPPERVPILQKEIIRRANEAKRIVIVATQMLESMTTSLRPTRAEATDVANAIFDGVDAVMLSAETSVGEHPVAAVEMMERITSAAEVEMEKSPWKPVHAVVRVTDFADAICDAATLVAAEVGAKYIVAFTQSGSTAQLLSKYRPPVPLIAFTLPQRSKPARDELGGEPHGDGDPGHDRPTDRGPREAADPGRARDGRDIVVLVCGARSTSASHEPHEDPSRGRQTAARQEGV